MQTDNPFYAYTSTLADWDPVKTIFLCPPAAQCKTVNQAEQFAIRSGWQSLAEANKCLLVVPVAPGGWDRLPADHLMNLYNQMKNSVKARQGKSIWGRGGTLWCWEILLYAVGYGDGAEFVSRVQVAYPSFLAAAALVSGATEHLDDGQKLSAHWLVPKASEDYHKRNCEIPVHTWIYTNHCGQASPLIQYLKNVNQADTQKVDIVDGKACTWIYDSNHPAHQTRVFENTAEVSPEHIFHNCFAHVVRWKNGPDGTLALVPSREEFYKAPTTVRRAIGLRGNNYDYFIHLPSGKAAADVKGLPLVVSLHGRGEPVWMYSNKNGWESLADETGAFVTLSPDSPGNIWFRTRDAEVFPQMIQAALEEFGLDKERVYLTGFSNGGTMTRELSLVYPELFTAISPWNGPGMDTCAMLEKDTSRLPNCILPELQSWAERLANEGWQMPAYMYYGDRDMGIGLDGNLLLPFYLKANGCQMEQDSCCPAGYHPDMENTYANQPERERFHTYVYNGESKNPMVCVTVMKNMPHGAIREQSRAAWEFLKHFRRPTESKSVVFEK